MPPKEKDFVAPILDLFKPNRKTKKGVTGVKYAGGFVYILNQGDEHSLLTESLVESCYLNDLGGITLGFSADVKYIGNMAGNVALRIPNSTPIGFSYDYVARIRKVDEIVVWENADVPEKKKLLRTR
jgi:hypothetical protein